MKDYIYLDQQRLNSTLAQLNGGLIQTFQRSEGESETNGEGNKKNVKISVGMKLLNASTSISNEKKLSNTSTSSEMLNFAMNDYAIDALLEQLIDESNFKENVTNASEGDVIHVKSEVNIYNFLNTSEMLRPENTELILNTVDSITENENNKIKIKQLREKKKANGSRQANKPIEVQIQKYQKMVDDYEAKVRENQALFTQIQRGTEFINNVMNSSLIVTGKEVMLIANRNDFRYSDAQLSFLANSKRVATILGTVISIQDETHEDGNFNQLEASEIDVIPRMFADTFLSNFKILKKGDKIISPIAIYFE